MTARLVSSLNACRQAGVPFKVAVRKDPKPARESLDRSLDMRRTGHRQAKALRPHGQPVILVLAQASVWMTLMVGHGGQHEPIGHLDPTGKGQWLGSQGILKKQTASGAPIGRNHWNYLFSALRAVRTHITSSPRGIMFGPLNRAHLIPLTIPLFMTACQNKLTSDPASTNANADPLPVSLNVECQLVESDYGPSGDVEIQTQVFAQGLFIPWGIAFLPDGDLLVTERDGLLRRIAQTAASSKSHWRSSTLVRAMKAACLASHWIQSFSENRAFSCM